jgi:hypothetical protein
MMSFIYFGAASLASTTEQQQLAVEALKHET